MDIRQRLGIEDILAFFVILMVERLDLGYDRADSRMRFQADIGIEIVPVPLAVDVAAEFPDRDQKVEMEMGCFGNVLEDAGDLHIAYVRAQDFVHGLLSAEVLTGGGLGDHDGIELLKGRGGVAFDKGEGEDIEEVAVDAE